MGKWPYYFLLLKAVIIEELVLKACDEYKLISTRNLCEHINKYKNKYPMLLIIMKYFRKKNIKFISRLVKPWQVIFNDYSICLFNMIYNMMHSPIY